MLTSHGVEPERARPLSQIESTLGIGETVSTLLEFLLVCLHATLELFCILGRRQVLGDNSAVDEAATHACVVLDVLLLDLVQTLQVVFLGVEGRHRVRKVLCFDEDIG